MTQNKKTHLEKVGVGQLIETATDEDWLALYTRRVYGPDTKGTGPTTGGTSPDATGDSTDPGELVRPELRWEENGERTYLQTTVPSSSLTDPTVRNGVSPEKSQNPKA